MVADFNNNGREEEEEEEEAIVEQEDKWEGKIATIFQGTPKLFQVHPGRIGVRAG